MASSTLTAQSGQWDSLEARHSVPGGHEAPAATALSATLPVQSSPVQRAETKHYDPEVAPAGDAEEAAQKKFMMQQYILKRKTDRPSNQGATLHVEWPSPDDGSQDLPMDDVVGYFEGFGQIVGSDMVDDGRGANLVKLDFADNLGTVMRKHRHVITRSEDGEQITVKIYVRLDTRRKDTQTK